MWGPGASLVVQTVKNLPADAGDAGSIPGWERSPGEGNSYPLQYSCRRIPWTEELGRLSPWGCRGLDRTKQPNNSSSQQLDYKISARREWIYVCIWLVHLATQ